MWMWDLLCSHITLQHRAHLEYAPSMEILVYIPFVPFVHRMKRELCTLQAMVVPELLHARSKQQPQEQWWKESSQQPEQQEETSTIENIMSHRCDTHLMDFGSNT
jgi:hypothetical protein